MLFSPKPVKKRPHKEMQLTNSGAECLQPTYMTELMASKRLREREWHQPSHRKIEKMVNVESLCAKLRRSEGD